MAGPSWERALREERPWECYEREEEQLGEEEKTCGAAEMRLDHDGA